MRVLTGIQIFNIIQSTKVLLAARQHHLYSDLQDSPAPFINQEPVTEETLAALVRSNMKLFDQYSIFIPATVELQVSHATALSRDLSKFHTHTIW